MRREEFERLYEEHARGLLDFLHYRTGNRAVAEDLAAETFTRVYEARRRFDRRRASEKTWVYSIALNCLRDTRRRADVEVRSLERVAASTQAAGPESERIEARDLLSRGMKVLSREEREAVALRYGAELTVPEIARLLRVPRSTAEGRVYGGLRKLRDELDPN